MITTSTILCSSKYTKFHSVVLILINFYVPSWAAPGAWLSAPNDVIILYYVCPCPPSSSGYPMIIYTQPITNNLPVQIYILIHTCMCILMTSYMLLLCIIDADPCDFELDDPGSLKPHSTQSTIKWYVHNFIFALVYCNRKLLQL